ncbi:MAG: GGDEF domain-containing protein [Lachnospiraceae bacterium]|nr:GGDEF domain-containing protein [Lachnospiraceae bacterium]
MRKKRLVALVVARPQREYNMDIISRLRLELRSRGMQLLVFGTFSELAVKDRNDYGEKSIFSIIPYDKLCGLIIQVGTFQDMEEADDIIHKAKEAGIPVIALDCEHGDLPGVVYDYEGAFARMVRHVVEVHKCRKIYMIAGMRNNSYSEGRIEVYKAVLREHGYPEESMKIWYGDFWEWPARRAVDEMITGNDIPDAIVCANDSMGLGVIAELEKSGYRVPDDVIVTGMDGIMMADYSTPMLSTITTDSERLCEEAAAMMDALTKGKDEYARKMRIPMRLELRGSCGCVEAETPDAGDKLRELDGRYMWLETNENSMARMRHRILDEEKENVFDKLAAYVSGDSWVVCNHSFWEGRAAGLEEDYDYRRRKKLFDDVLTATAISPAGEPDERVYSVDMDRKDLLPDLDAVTTYYDLLIFCPLNFQEEVIGYYAFSDIGDDIFPFMYQQLCTSLSMVLRVVRDRSQSEYTARLLEQSNRVLYDLSIHDELTGLLNRRGLMQYVEEVCEGHSGSGMLNYCYIDIDGFKDINDKWGHDEGDVVLRLVADELVKCTEAFPGNVVSRIGGDEYVIFGLIDEAKTQERLISGIKKAFDELNENDEREYLIELSVGESIGAEVSLENAMEIMREADRNMYRSKKKRKALKRKQ